MIQKRNLVVFDSETIKETEYPGCTIHDCSFKDSREEVLFCTLSPEGEISGINEEDTYYLFLTYKSTSGSSGQVTIGDSSESFEEGDLIFIPSGTYHKIVNHRGRPFHFLSFKAKK